MQKLIILTILLTSLTAQAEWVAPKITNMEQFADFFVEVGNKKLSHSEIRCFDNDGLGFFQCKLVKLPSANPDGYNYEHEWLSTQLDKMNKSNKLDGFYLPDLTLRKEG